MARWDTNLFTANDNIKIKIKRDIFQGVALSAPWFCETLNPQSNALKSSGNDYHLPHTNEIVGYLMYMDDIKVMSNMLAGHEKLLGVTENISNVKWLHLSRPIHKKENVMQLKIKLLPRTGERVISSMSIHETYKYLGVL